MEGTLGQWMKRPPRNNHIYLVETIKDVASLKVNYPQDIAYVTQTTLSVDDTQAIIQALQANESEGFKPEVWLYRGAWQEFVALYGPVVYGFARKRGLQDADAADRLDPVVDEEGLPAARQLALDPLARLARVAADQERRRAHDPRRGPAELETLIERTLAFEPAERPTARQFADDFNREIQAAYFNFQIDADSWNRKD